MPLSRHGSRPEKCGPRDQLEQCEDSEQADGEVMIEADHGLSPKRMCKLKGANYAQSSRSLAASRSVFQPVEKSARFR